MRPPIALPICHGCCLKQEQVQEPNEHHGLGPKESMGLAPNEHHGLDPRYGEVQSPQTLLIALLTCLPQKQEQEAKQGLGPDG